MHEQEEIHQEFRQAVPLMIARGFYASEAEAYADYLAAKKGAL